MDRNIANYIDSRPRKHLFPYNIIILVFRVKLCADIKLKTFNDGRRDYGGYEKKAGSEIILFYPTMTYHIPVETY
jgi:hypothetical protein